jgi:hypothetical protein
MVAIAENSKAIGKNKLRQYETVGPIAEILRLAQSLN